MANVTQDLRERDGEATMAVTIRPAHYLRGHLSRGEPDREFEVDSMVILPDTELWNICSQAAEPILFDFMKRTEELPKEKLFPFLIVSDSPTGIPPAPAICVCSNLYRRILSCVDIEIHPGSKERGPRVVGDFQIRENSYQLSHLAVQIVSQLQVVADDKKYEELYHVFKKQLKNIKVYASQNATVVGLMGLLYQLKKTSEEHQSMKWDRLHAIETLCFIGDPLPPAEEYRCRCTRYLEVQIIDSLLRFVQKAREFDLQVVDGSLYEHVLWTSESFKIKVWDVTVNVAMCTNELFNPSTYPFIETYTSNIGRDRPIFRQHFDVPRLVASMDTTNNQTIECCRTWDLDIVELRRQYPDIHWDRASYRDEIIKNENPRKPKGSRSSRPWDH